MSDVISSPGSADNSANDTGIVGVGGNSAGDSQQAPRSAGRPKGNQVDYPGLFVLDESGESKRVKLDAIPNDWDKAQHKMLSTSDFADEADYLDWRGGLYLERGQKMIDKAAALRKLGTPEQREAASKLERYAAKMDELRKQLAASGQDPDMILAMLAGKPTDEEESE